MLNKKAIDGLINAPPEKRYKSFLCTVTDLEAVWLLLSEDGYATLDADGFTHVLVWPREEFCKFMSLENDKPVSIEIHKFLEKCKTLDKSIRFMVFPTDVNTYVVTVDQLCEDIQEHLDELE